MDDRRRLELAGWAVAVFVVVLLGVRTLDRAEAGPAAPPVVEEKRRSSREKVVVAVAGEVRRPGIVRVRAGARVDVAIRRAGGLTRRGDPTAVNLAARLEDGQQIVIPARGPQAAAGAAGPGTAAGPISLASATVEQLDTIDGIGPTLAQRIVDYRTENGGFRSIEELQEVEGIGEARFETLREALQP